MATQRELIERVGDLLTLSGIGGIPPATIARLLEQAQQSISRDLRFPRRYLKRVDATAPFALPSEARLGGLLYAEFENDVAKPQVTIPILSIQEANDIGIQWDVTDSDLSEYRWDPVYGRYLIVYDPGTINAPVYPLGFETGDTIRLLYWKKPVPMTEPSHLPFDGLLAEYAGDMLSHYVAFEVLLGRGADQAQAHYNHYLDLREQTFQSTKPPYWLPRAQAGEQA